MRWNRLSPLLAVPLVAIVGCNKPEVDFTLISLGMTKEEVIAKIGKPTRVSVQREMEYFEYEAYDKRGIAGVGYVKEHFRFRYIRFYGGKVESFGEKGDFDTTKTPTSRVEVDKKVSIDSREEVIGGKSSAPAPFDLKTELEKLDNLKKNGLITEAEFKELRQRAMDKARTQ